MNRHLKFSIVEFIIGGKAKFYSIKFDGEELSEAEKFFDSLSEEYSKGAEALAQKIERMAERVGCPDYMFKMSESKRTDNICALYDEELRLYCLRYGNTTVILGNGGVKPKGIRTYQEKEDLYEAVKALQGIEPVIYQEIISKELRQLDSGEFVGIKPYYQKDNNEE